MLLSAGLDRREMTATAMLIMRELFTPLILLSIVASPAILRDMMGLGPAMGTLWLALVSRHSRRMRPFLEQGLPSDGTHNACE